MRVLLVPACLALVSVLPASAQTSCDAAALPNAAKQVASVRKQLQRQAVSASDAGISAPVAQQLGQLKDALTVAAGAAFACAASTDSPEQIQTRLAEALHANLPPEDSTAETKGNKETGVYGTDLAVHLYELFGKPRLFEVDFRYGIQCGDDNLLLVFENAGTAANTPWREQMRYDAAQYKTVGDALGDFVLLTPLTGSYKRPIWRYVVAHGHPGCSDIPRPSTFDLDLVTPTANPARPALSWHFEHGYTQGNTTPSLATTEDTIRFTIYNGPPPSGPVRGTPAEYRFHLTSGGHVEPSPAGPATPNSATPATATPR